MNNENPPNLIKRYPELNYKSSEAEACLVLPCKSKENNINSQTVQWCLTSKEEDKIPSTANYVIHRAFINQRYNERKGTAKTLTRAEVRGGGRKPWRQKGTGRARAGSNRSPLWRGGGVSFGPHPKVYKHKINRKEWQLALRKLLLQKRNQILVIDNSELISLKNKTSALKNIFQQFEIDLTQRIVIITNKKNANLLKITRNIKTIQVLNANNLNLRKILDSKRLVITKDSLKIIKQIYNT